MNTSVIKLKGGLGNQFFQYAYGKHTGCSGYDLSWFNEAPINRDYHLDKFNTKVNIKENGDNCKKEGYWQDYSFVKPLLPELREELVLRSQNYTPKYKYLREGIKRTKSVAMHIRRDDYLILSHKYYNLQQEYYDRAVQMMENVLNDFYIFVFSDDMDWCRENIKYENSIYVDIEPCQAFDLMRLCKHHIIANSTFSWWAAALSEGIVVAPKKWFNIKDKQDKVSTTLNLPEWITI